MTITYTGKQIRKECFGLRLSKKKKVNGTDLGVQKYSHVHGHDI